MGSKIYESLRQMYKYSIPGRMGNANHVSTDGASKQCI